MSALRAARRDASWFPNPGRAGRYHVLAETDADGSLGTFVADTQGCCGIRVTVCDYATLSIDEVPAVLRCRKSGCRERWPS